MCSELKGLQRLNRTLSERVFECKCGCIAERDLNAALNIERHALQISRRSGFTETLNGRGEAVRPLAAGLFEASKVAEERQPARLVL
ncbi:MAG TPA: hypothetical protein EYP85_15905 [Armatimonadetes bacterium]|nr:hypothetical protein [Armatimonadota bacterium]